MTSSALVTSSAIDPTADRIAEVSRNTAETRITVRINLDGTGQAKLHTGIGFFDHMLDGFARHGLSLERGGIAFLERDQRPHDGG